MPIRLLSIAIVVLLVLVACTNDDSGPCRAVQRESLADDSGVHVIPSADVRYESEPPTSGPHSPGPEAGLYSRTLTGPEQVGVLERGDVVVQYRPSDIEGSQLEVLLDGDVVLTPNPELTDAIVVTAWRARRHCTSLDIAALRDFVANEKNSNNTHR